MSPLPLSRQGFAVLLVGLLAVCRWPGVLPPMTTLLNGTPEEVYAAAGQCHAACGRHFIVGSGCEVSPLTPPENLRALVRYAQEHA